MIAMRIVRCAIHNLRPVCGVSCSLPGSVPCRRSGHRGAVRWTFPLQVFSRCARQSWLVFGSARE
jgi:hypothetical protein